jgi:hypothetical protein
MRPQYSPNPNLCEIWPYDPWSRGRITELASTLGLSWTEVPTTMGTPALKFDPVAFDHLLFFLKELT